MQIQNNMNNKMMSLDALQETENDKEQFVQSGRSMVEMLGVLAVIGVLSVGGIAGYSYGMNKYRANETINDVNLRAMDVISQLTQRNTPNLASWATTSTAGYPISLNSDEALSNYYIRVEKVPLEVCDIISEIMPDNVEILVDNDTHSCADGENVMDFVFEEFKTDNTRNTSVCPTGTSAEGLGGYAYATDPRGNRCYCEIADTKWDVTTSTCIAQDGSCSSYVDCDRDEYCQFLNVRCEKIPTVGKCLNISECSEGTENEGFWMSDNVFSVEGCKLDPWTAADLCAAKNMRMATREDIGCNFISGGDNTCTSQAFISLKDAGMLCSSRSCWLDRHENTSTLYSYELGTSGVIGYSCGNSGRALCVK